MSAVSKEILDKLRQLSDLLVVIKDSGNNTPQILKELAVEKCSEIYNALSSGQEVVENKIVETPKNEKVEEPVIENNTHKEEIVEEVVVEDFQPTEEVELNEIEYKEEITPQTTIEESVDTEEETSSVETIEEEIAVEETESYEEDEEQYNEEEYPEEQYTEGEYQYSDEQYTEEEYTEEEDDIVLEEEVDLFAPKENFKKCSHKKIRSLLVFGDIFLYKRELFGNSDVDMTDMFDGIDEAESFDDAMELINEYFGDDVNSEELVMEFVEKVKQCFE
jgi:hypothetical protein